MACARAVLTASGKRGSVSDEACELCVLIVRAPEISELGLNELGRRPDHHAERSVYAEAA